MSDLIDHYILTIDVDWAPDFAIDHVANILIEHNVKSTWFITHRSKAIERLRIKPKLFELGIHPNMLPGSTHGCTEEQVLTHVLDIVPGATSMRTHGLYQTSNWLAKAANEFGILTDVSLFLPRTANITAHQLHWKDSSLWRIPYFWEDDAEMYEKNPIWKISDNRLNINGLKVFNFHPIHIVLNTNRFEWYEHLKQIRPLKLWDESFAKEHAQKGIGPQTFFLDLVKNLSGHGIQIKEMVNQLNDNI